MLILATLTPVQAVGIFLGIPLALFALIAAAVYAPGWRRRRRFRRADDQRPGRPPPATGDEAEQPPRAADDHARKSPRAPDDDVGTPSDDDP